MTDEQAFLRAFLDDPADAVARLAYADWLEENGRPGEAAFLRTQAELAGLRPKSKARAGLEARLRDLAAGLDGDWLARVSQPPVENCPPRFKFRCPRRWDLLEATDDVRVRYCDACRKNVCYCETMAKARRHAILGRCVAIDCRVPRTPGDLPHFREVRMGRIAVPLELPTSSVERVRLPHTRRCHRRGR
jgi:uncharacterized protein (TIGR02996 family)